MVTKIVTKPAIINKVNTQTSRAKGVLPQIKKVNKVNQARLDDRARRANLAKNPTANYSTPEGMIKAQDQVNNPNQINPYGSQSVTIDPKTGQRVVTQTLEQGQQNLLNQQTGNNLATENAYNSALGSANNMMGQPFNYDGMQGVDVQNDATRQRVEDAYYGRAKSLLDRDFQDQNANVVRDLRARGIEYGSPQWNDQVGRVQTNQNNTLTSLADQAVLSGGQEAQNLFGRQSALRSQQGQERLSLRNQPLNELSIISQNRGSVRDPNFTPYQGADVAGIADAFNQRNFQAQQSQLDRNFQAQQNALNRRVAGGGGAGMDPIARAQALQDIEDNSWKNRMQYQNMMTPKPKSPSVISQISGLGGQILGAWAGGGFKNPFGSPSN